MVHRASRLRWIGGAALFFALLTSLPCPAAGAKTPLRIWVMHSEHRPQNEVVPPAAVEHALDALQSDGILIENTAQNLRQPGEGDTALASFITGPNSFLDLLRAYLRAHPGSRPVAVEFLRWNDAFDRIRSGLASGDPSARPDVVELGSTWIPSFADQGLIEELSAEIDEQDFFPASIASTRPFGREGIYAVPWFVDVRVLFYRRDRVADAADLGSWEALNATCAANPRPGGRPLFGFAAGKSWNLLHNLLPWLWASGGDIVVPRSFGPLPLTRVALDSPQSLQALHELRGLAENGCAEISPLTQEVLDQQFRDGAFGAVISGPWMLRYLPPGLKHAIGVALPPAGPAGSFAPVGGAHLALTRASQERGTRTEALALIAYLTSPEAELSYATATGLLPSRREALQRFTARLHEPAIEQALERGRSVPAIAEWAQIVENDLVHGGLENIWRDLAQGAPVAQLDATAAAAATDLRYRLLAATAVQAAPSAGIAALLLIAAFVTVTLWLRRRERRMQQLCAQQREELAEVEAQRRLVEGESLLLRRTQETHAERLTALQSQLTALDTRAASLAAALEQAKARGSCPQSRNPGPCEIASDGTLRVDGREVRFENSRQARRLMELLTRQALFGRDSVHCLWGFVLFGWERSRIATRPNRLFEVAAAKVNGRLKAMGMPPVIGRTGRESCSWTLLWDRARLLAGSAISQAQAEAERAIDLMARDAADGAEAAAIRSLTLDPKNLQAFAVALDCRSRQGIAASSGNAHAGVLLNKSLRAIEEEAAALTAGIAEAEALMGAELPRGIDRSAASEAIEAMRGREQDLDRRIREAAAGAARPPRGVMGEIRERLAAVQQQIGAMKARGAADAMIWATVVGGSDFTRLIALPQVGALIHDLYNHDIGEREDPRVVQLALVSMLQNPGRNSAIGRARDVHELIATMEKGVREQLAGLARRIETLSVM